jgi:ubiquinone/menaquinone biosynthesis C-methylase UbiE
MNSDREWTQNWYKKYYEKKGSIRNDLLSNPEVLFQHLALEDSVISILRRIAWNRQQARILDVGCGGGTSLARFLQFGFRAQNLCGIDINPERIKEAKDRYPNIEFVCDDAAAMPYGSETFDLVLESTMFVQIMDEKIAKGMAGEMLRVAKPKGHILLIDWRYSKPFRSDYLGLSKKRIRILFSVGSESRIISQTPGALVPPVGRAISKYARSLYFIVRMLFPLLVGQKSTLLQKN